MRRRVRERRALRRSFVISLLVVAVVMVIDGMPLRSLGWDLCLAALWTLIILDVVLNRPLYAADVKTGKQWLRERRRKRGNLDEIAR